MPVQLVDGSMPLVSRPLVMCLPLAVTTVPSTSFIPEGLYSILEYLPSPFVTLTWTAEDSIVAAGHDCPPILFSGSYEGWQSVGSLDDTTAPKSAGGTRAGFGGSSSVGRLNSTAFNTFRNADSRGVSNVVAASTPTDTELMTVHQNTITSIRPYETQGGAVSRVSTSGVDGKLVIWNVGSVGGGVSTISGRLGGMHLR